MTVEAVRVRAMRLPRPRQGVGLILVASTALVVLLLVAGEFAPYRPAALSGDPLSAPSSSHLLGTNKVGQDVLSQLLVGARTSIIIALIAGSGAVAIGSAVGLLATWVGRVGEVVLMRLVDVTLVIPRLPLLFILSAYLGASLAGTAAAIVATSWAPAARVIRARTRNLRGRGHVRAATGFNASGWYVAARHIVPDIAPVMLALFVATAARAVTLEAGLALLGIGDPTRISWGSMIREAIEFRSLFRTDAWQWWLLPPVAALAGVVYGTSLIATSLDTRANPESRRGFGA